MATPRAAPSLHPIAVASERVGVPTHTLRYWESRGVYAPERTPGGQRRYSAEAIASLKRFRRLLDTGRYTLDGALEECRILDRSSPA